MARKPKPALEDTELSSTVAAKLLGITQQYFNTVVRAGWIKATSKGRYRLVDVVQGYKAFILDEGRRTSKSAEASRVQAARAAQIELQTAKERGKLWDADTAEAVFAEAWGMFRSELTGVPAASTRDLSIRAEIAKQINDALDRCDARLANGAAGLRANKEGGDMEGEEPDAG